MPDAVLIDGRAEAQKLRADVAVRVRDLNFQPGLAVILVGDDPASHVYVGNKIKACHEVGIRSFESRLPARATQAEVLAEIQAFNDNKSIHGILLQLPLPAHLNADALTATIKPGKDVDGLTPLNMGLLMCGRPALVPCTPQGAMLLIHSVEKNLAGLHALVIGRSLLFGKPMGQLLLQADCTLTQAHSRTRNLPELCAQADILVAAIGKPNFVKGDWIKPGAIVIDVGINRISSPYPPASGGEVLASQAQGGSLCGDVDFESAKQKARAITPVPGGVGPMTIACLLNNTLKAASAC